MTFAERLKHLREAKGLSQRQLEQAAGIQHGIVSRIEAGVRGYPSVPTVLALARVLGVTVEELCRDAEDEDTASE
jgi:transcriptional regulator with XRE-family HTH domain